MAKVSYAHAVCPQTMAETPDGPKPAVTVREQSQDARGCPPNGVNLTPPGHYTHPDDEPASHNERTPLTQVNSECRQPFAHGRRIPRAPRFRRHAGRLGRRVAPGKGLLLSPRSLPLMRRSPVQPAHLSDAANYPEIVGLWPRSLFQPLVSSAIVSTRENLSSY